MYHSVPELRVHDDGSEQGIANELDLTVSTVKVRAVRARNLLREALPRNACQPAA